MPQRSQFQELTEGLLKQNMAFVLGVGVCQMLATTTGLKNAAAMALAVVALTAASNITL